MLFVVGFPLRAFCNRQDAAQLDESDRLEKLLVTCAERGGGGVVDGAEHQDKYEKRKLDHVDWLDPFSFAEVCWKRRLFVCLFALSFALQIRRQQEELIQKRRKVRRLARLPGPRRADGCCGAQDVVFLNVEFQSFRHRVIFHEKELSAAPLACLVCFGRR